MTTKRSILFVCSGNTCRSPMAKIILEQMLVEKRLADRFEVDSAASRGPDGECAHPNARKAIQDLYGQDLLADHVPKALTPEMAAKADLILVMKSHYLKPSIPEEKVVVLNIEDPFNQDESVYKARAAEIQQRLIENWPKIVGTDTLSETEANPELSSPSSLSLSAVDRVYEKVLAIAKEVDYGRGAHAHTVTRLLLNMYDDMVAVGLIGNTPEKRKLTEIAGLSHDIGVGSEKAGEAHHETGFRMIKEEYWTDNLPIQRKHALAVVLYAIFYHKPPVPGGKLESILDIPFYDYRVCAEVVSLLRVADGLDYGALKGSPNVVEKLQMVRTPQGVECRVTTVPRKHYNGQLQAAWKKREVFEATFGKLTFWLPGEGTSWNLWKAGM